MLNGRGLPGCPRAISALFLIALAGTFISPSARGQESHGEETLNEWGLWGSVSVNSPDVYGSRAHGNFGALGFRYGRVISASRRRVIEYMVDVLPAEAIHQPSYTPCVFSAGKAVSYCATGQETVYGGGIAPLGWKFTFRPQARFQPFAALSGGLIATVERIPTDIPGEALVNFTAEWQLGFLRFNASRKRAWMVGYKLEHISDAFRTSVNPGIDLNVFFIGYSFFK